MGWYLLVFTILKIICGHSVHIITFSKTFHRAILFRFKRKGINYFTAVSDFPQKIGFCKLVLLCIGSYFRSSSDMFILVYDKIYVYIT